MKILLLGAQGQLGEALAEIVPTEALKWGRSELDLQRMDLIAPKIVEAHPNIVINAAALTDVDACETKGNLAIEINEEAPGVLAKVCKHLHAVLVHISTDYVFGADEERRTPYVESDKPGPVNVYGRTKWYGEQKVMESGGEYLIIRTCGLYGGRGAKSNYVERVIARAKTGARLQATVDQVYSPTFVGELARAIWRLIGEQRRGMLHVVNTGLVSRFEFTKTIVEMRGYSVPVEEARRADFGGAKRPRFSALDSERIALREYMSDWKQALTTYLTTAYVQN